MHEMHLQGLIEDNLHCDCPYEHVDQGLIFSDIPHFLFLIRKKKQKSPGESMLSC